jgi:hypothetical protein
MDSAWIPLVIGAAAIIGALVDPRKYFTKLYEDSPDTSWVSGLSESPEALRMWIGIAGCFGIGVGLAFVI